MNVKKSRAIYEEESVLNVRYYHPKSDDYLEYIATITIRDFGKTPVQMKLEFQGIPPFVAPMPPEEHTIKAKSVLDLYAKVRRWFQKHGYELI